MSVPTIETQEDCRETKQDKYVLVIDLSQSAQDFCKIKFAVEKEM